MNKPLISIIIPCYNAVNYIHRCMESVAKQTYKNIEALLIDDCGTDKTFDAVNCFLKDYTGNITFKVFKQKHNMGVSAARNRGLKEAKGEYIYFLDSDDSITEHCIEKLVDIALTNKDVEMVIGNYKIIGPLYFAPFAMQERIYTSKEIIDATFTHVIYGMPWNKLMKKDFIIRNNLFFIEGILHEDIIWCCYCALCLNKVRVVLERTYNYYVHQYSITTQDSKRNHQEHRIKGIMYLIDYIFCAHHPDQKDVRNNITVYRYIETQLQELLMDPILEGNEDIAVKRYNQLRQHKYWSLSDIMSMRELSKKERTRHIHWLLPKKLGYTYYKKRHLRHHYLQPETYHMKITIITINYNNLKGLQRTVPSVVSQTYTGYEYIVVDGGSTDGSKEYIASQERIDTWISEPDKGIYNAMNKAVKMAHGEYCLFMNSGDTFFSPQVLEQCVYQLKDYDYFGGRSVFIDKDQAYPFIPPRNLSIGFLLVNALNHQSVFSKTSILIKYPFNEHHGIISDWEQYFKAWYLHGYTYAPLDTFVAIYYMDGISSTNKELCNKERDEVVREIINESGEKGKELQDEYYKLLNTRTPSTEKDNIIIHDNDNSKKARRRARRNKYKECLKHKTDKALSKKSPLLRDLGVVRYGLKYFFKDLFL